MTDKKKFKAYFLSDIHLGSAKEPNYLLLVKFLKSLVIEPPTHIFLVGDIFDLWISDHQYFINKYQELIKALDDLKKESVEIHYFEGNHDLYLDDFWQTEMGFKVHHGPAHFILGSFDVRVEHGDQMDPNDKGYRFLRWFLRTKPVSFICRNLPGQWAARIGESASSKSRVYTSNVKTISAEDSLGKLHRHAQLCAEQKFFDFMISGHIHLQDDFEFDCEGRKARSVNLGTWLDQARAFVLDESGGQWLNL